jgi:hypothetical protein
MTRLRYLFKKYSSIFQSQGTPNVFIPLFILLTSIALVNSLQTVHITKGKATIDLFLSYWISKTIYCWYYILMAVLIQQLSIRIHLVRVILWKWLAVHGIVLIGSISFHQLLSLWVDTLIWKGKINVSYSDLLLKNLSVWLDVTVYICFILGFYMIEYRRINQENEMKYSQLESQLLKSQLQELRNVIHPQFLFDTLQSIGDLLDKNKNKEANRLLTGLSNVLRTTVYESEHDKRTLEEELQYTRDYIFIENVQFPKGLLLRAEIEAGISNALIPNFVLQPLVERYIKHALFHRLPSYTIRITGKKLFHELVLCVEEEGTYIVRSNDEQQQDEALCDIITDRLLHLYQDNQQFQKTQNVDGGITIQIKIPFQEQVPTVKKFITQEKRL